MKTATGRRIDQIWYHARDADQSTATDVLLWHGIDQAARVGMFGILEEFAHRRFFDHAPGIHHGHAFATARDHTKIVGDKQNGQAELFDQGAYQAQDLRLNGDIESRRRFIGDQQIRIACQGHSDQVRAGACRH